MTQVKQGPLPAPSSPCTPPRPPALAISALHFEVYIDTIEGVN